MRIRSLISNPERLSFRMTYCLSFLIKTLMLKLFIKCRQTNFGTSDGLEQVNGLNSAADERRSNIHLNNQTGDLTIRNIQIKQSGVYKVEINTNSMILHRKLKITVGGVNNITVKVGESVTLSTSLIKIEGYDLILWKFEDHIITEINEGTNKFLLHDSSYERFRGRLQRNEKTGSLTISDSRTTDSGVYHLNMSSSSHSLQRTISLIVSALSLSSRDILMIFCGGGGGVLVGVAVALAFYCHKKSRRETQRPEEGML